MSIRSSNVVNRSTAVMSRSGSLDESCRHGRSIVRQRIGARAGTISMPTHISVWGYMYPLVFPFGGTCSFLRVHIF